MKKKKIINEFKVKEEKSSKKRGYWLYLIGTIICVLVIGLGVYNVCSKLQDKKDNSQNVEIKISDNDKSIEINDKKLSKVDLKLTDDAKINSSKVYKKSNLVFASIIEPTFQFDTHYLLCFDKDGNLIFEARNFYDKDNDGNRYKYNGKFEYDENKNVLSFYTQLFLGENDEATGKAFNDKEISELTSAEKKRLGNYSDVVKYEYKYINKNFQFLEKEEISKLKNNEYYKNDLSN